MEDIPASGCLFDAAQRLRRAALRGRKEVAISSTTTDKDGNLRVRYTMQSADGQAVGEYDAAKGEIRLFPLPFSFPRAGISPLFDP